MTIDVMTMTTQSEPTSLTRYRLPDDARLGRVRLQVSDLGASIPYYTRVLGFRVLSHKSAVATLGSADGTVLVELHEQPGVQPVPRGGRIGLYHFAILLPDRTALGRFVAHLGDIGAYAGSADHLVSEALYLGDPDGLGIEVYADRPRSTWTMNGGETAMTTKPLDFRALVRAAAGQPWDGMPTGTTIGHVHFHVETLEAAEAFYDKALGFDTVVRSYPGALFFSAGGYHHHVGANTWAGPAPLARPNEARLLEWELALPTNHDVAAVAANAVTAGYDVRANEDAPLVADPSGVTVRLTHQKEQL
jgi:catechol 2,3-dioxygenase